MMFTYLYQSEYLLTYLTLGILVLVSSYSDMWTQYLTPHFHQLLFRDELRNPLLTINHQVRTYGEISQDKT
jgi:hypothetical protein